MNFAQFASQKQSRMKKRERERIIIRLVVLWKMGRAVERWKYERYEIFPKIRVRRSTQSSPDGFILYLYIVRGVSDFSYLIQIKLFLPFLKTLPLIITSHRFHSKCNIRNTGGCDTAISTALVQMTQLLLLLLLLLLNH